MCVCVCYNAFLFYISGDGTPVTCRMLREEKKNRKRLIAELLSRHDDTFQVAYSSLQSEGIEHSASLNLKKS